VGIDSALGRDLVCAFWYLVCAFWYLVVVVIYTHVCVPTHAYMHAHVYTCTRLLGLLCSVANTQTRRVCLVTLSLCLSLAFTLVAPQHARTNTHAHTHTHTHTRKRPDIWSGTTVQLGSGCHPSSLLSTPSTSTDLSGVAAACALAVAGRTPSVCPWGGRGAEMIACGFADDANGDTNASVSLLATAPLLWLRSLAWGVGRGEEGGMGCGGTGVEALEHAMNLWQ